MTPEKRGDLRTDAIEEMENDHRLDLHERGEHDERRDSLCRSCEEALEAATEEHAWMGRSTFPVNPYSPEPAWSET